MASLKRSYTKTTLLDLSAKIMDRLEETDLFQQASCIALYHAIPGEVQTAGLIEKWYRKKRLLLPLIKGNDLQLLLYAGKESLKTGVFGILEPSEDCEAVPESEIDLIIVPGVAFDRQHNRLGRGKGFYDRLLSTLDVPKIGICYDFQLKDQIPAEPFDRKMDLPIILLRLLKCILNKLSADVPVLTIVFYIYRKLGCNVVCISFTVAGKCNITDYIAVFLIHREQILACMLI